MAHARSRTSGAKISAMTMNGTGPKPTEKKKTKTQAADTGTKPSPVADAGSWASTQKKAPKRSHC